MQWRFRGGAGSELVQRFSPLLEEAARGELDSGFLPPRSRFALMQQYALRDVERLLQMTRGAVLGLVRAGFVAPVRGRRGEYRFSFQDLIVLRTAGALTAAQVPTRRITRALRALQRYLPTSVPLSGLRILAMGDQVVVQDGGRRWQADSGQYLLELDVRVTDGVLSVLAQEQPGPIESAEEWYRRGWQSEASSAPQAREAYERALELDSTHCGARINLGRLLHLSGQFAPAERVYREGLQRCGSDPLLLFNLGVLLDDAGRSDEAIQAYKSALGEDPQLADGHYNLALLYEANGNKLGALRHLREYRKLTRGGDHQ